jgi:hypothetical protein
MTVKRAVAHLEQSLGRPIRWNGRAIVQECPVCRVELVLWDWDAPSFEVLFQRVFAFYDEHTCRGLPCTVEQAYERAESAAVRIGEHAQRLAFAESSEFPALYDRAEGESVAMAARADALAKRSRSFEMA